MSGYLIDLESLTLEQLFWLRNDVNGEIVKRNRAIDAAKVLHPSTPPLLRAVEE